MSRITAPERTTPKIAAPSPAQKDRPPGAAAGATAITPDRIRARAYEIYRARNGGPGNAVSDWLQAEREVKGAAAIRTAPPAVRTKTDTRGEKLLASGE